MLSEYPQWMLFGDSITFQSFRDGGLGQRLSETYARRLDVLNRGFGSYNSEWAKLALPHILARTSAASPPLAVCVWLGANDATALPNPRHVSKDRYVANLNGILDMIMDIKPRPIVLMLSPPPICVKQWAEYHPDEFVAVDQARTQSYAEASLDVARNRGTFAVDVHSILVSAAGSDRDAGLWRILLDGVHLSPEGYALVYDALVKLVNQSIPELQLENLPFRFPEWNQIDPKAPQLAFPEVPQSSTGLDNFAYWIVGVVLLGVMCAVLWRTSHRLSLPAWFDANTAIPGA